jgi:hypothetical protein
LFTSLERDLLTAIQTEFEKLAAFVGAQDVVKLAAA